MQPCFDETAFQWIEEGRLPVRGPADERVWAGNTVANLLPQTFEAYTKILHRIDARHEWIDNPLSREEVHVLGLPSCSQVEAFVLRARSIGRSTRVRWKDVCALLELPFSAGITDDWFRERMASGCWPRYFSGPSDSCFLDAEEIAELVRLVSNNDVGAHFARLPFVPLIGTDTALLYRGELADVPRLNIDDSPPEYWWPESKNWCVCSDYDLPFTVVGGPKNLIDRVLSSDLLEAVAVTPNTRIDYKSPIA